MTWFLLSLLIGCSSPYDTKLPPDPTVWAALPEVRDLPPEEQRLLAAFAVRRVFGAPPVEDLGTALEVQRQFEIEAARREAEAAALAARVEAEQAAARQILFDTVAVSIVRFVPLEPNVRAGRYTRSIEVRVAFENKTDKPIAAVQGVFHFVNSFDEPIKQVNVTYEGGVPPRAVATWLAGIEVNQFISEDMRLFTDPGTVRAIWQPERVLFEDGTRLALTD